MASLGRVAFSLHTASTRKPNIKPLLWLELTLQIVLLASSCSARLVCLDVSMGD